jgi:hypothetical protein
MKQRRRCPKCQSVRIGHLDRLPDTLGPETRVTWRHLALVKENDKLRPTGRLEAYVCTECGYLETYVVEPHRVPFEKLEGFSWVGDTVGGPYR